MSTPVPPQPTGSVPPPPLAYGQAPGEAPAAMPFPAQPGAPAPGHFTGPAAGQLPGQFAAPMPGSCRFCGSLPAVQAKVHGHQGFLIMMKFLNLEGPFCRDCGLFTVRRMTARSMWQGWWGFLSMLINPLTMLSNLVPWWKIRKLAPPVPGAPGRPMEPGRPLWQRIEIAGLLLPVVLVAVIAFAAGKDPDYADTGDCVHNSGTTLHPDVSVVDCGGSDAEFKVVGRTSTTADAACDDFADVDAAYVVSGRTSYTLCLARLGR